MTIDELIPSILPLSQAEKIRLLQAVLQQLTQETSSSGQAARSTSEHFDQQGFHGATYQRSARHNPLKGSVTFEKNIVSPIGDDWDAAQ